jgi:hypothetical protein
MNKIVREHYAVAKLPEDLREGLDPEGTVTITVVQSEAEDRRSPGLEAIREYRRSHEPHYRNDAEILDHIRRVRDGEPL